MLIILVGPKGSGKSHIGRLLESELGVHFFHVEPLWMAYHADCERAQRERSIVEGIAHVHPALEKALSSHERVCVETTGASIEILDDLLRLGEAHGRLLARINTPLETCLERIESRDPTNQIPMNAESIREVYEKGSAVDLPFDLAVENVDASDDAIVESFFSALAAFDEHE